MQEAKSIEADYKDKGFGVEIEDIREKNYVIFDGSLINILRKYGLLAPLVKWRRHLPQPLWARTNHNPQEASCSGPTRP